jgi:predicted Fe-Mo cluster-binding NifX family protein
MSENNITSFTGKIAVASDDQLTVAGHLGRCRAFMIFEINNGTVTSKEWRENTFTHHRMMEASGQQPHHHEENHGHSHAALVDGIKDCSYLISRGGGWRVVEDLKSSNIQPVFADVEKIDNAVNLFVKGELINNDEYVCRHH